MSRAETANKETTLSAMYSLPLGDPDLIRAALSVLQDQWGVYGYRAGLRLAGPAGVVLEVEHSDGSRFHLYYWNDGSWFDQDVTR